ncbi:MAG TPA: DNA starvation/stationary phase protection protein [Edaphocola sp.]|nr:DNA starvation/stationary phase protection protein [Edaphocola sp.]
MAKAKKQMTRKDDIGISEATRKKIAVQLNKLLANESVLYLKTRKFHWNIVGKQFHDMHLFLEAEYGILANTIDEIAERIRQMDFFAQGSMKQFLADATLKEHEQTAAITPDMLTELLADHSRLICDLRSLIDVFDEEYKDAGGADFLTGLLRKHEKSAWMIRSTLG